MKIELTDKEIELIGKERWYSTGGVRWRKWLFYSVLIFILIGFCSIWLADIVRIPLILLAVVPIIICLVLWNRDGIKAGRDFLTKIKDGGD